MKRPVKYWWVGADPNDPNKIIDVEKSGMFIGWGLNEGQTAALIERADGSVLFCSIGLFRFDDHRELKSIELMRAEGVIP
jgi:hypothetical protein